MRKLVTALVALSLVLLCAAACAGSLSDYEAFVPNAFAPFESDDGMIFIESIEDPAKTTPKGMTADQRAIRIGLSVPDGYLDSKPKSGAFKNEFTLMSANSLYRPGSLARGKDDEGGVILYLNIAIPKDSAAEDFFLVYGGQARWLCLEEDVGYLEGTPTARDITLAMLNEPPV